MKNRFNPKVLMILQCITQGIPRIKLDIYLSNLEELAADSRKSFVLSLVSFRLIGTLLGELSSDELNDERIKPFYNRWMYSFKQHFFDKKLFGIENLYFSKNKLMGQKLISDLSVENCKNKALFICAAIRIFGTINLSAATALRDRKIPTDQEKRSDEWSLVIQCLLEIDFNNYDQSIKDEIAKILLLLEDDHIQSPQGEHLYIGPIIAQLRNEGINRKFQLKVIKEFEDWHGFHFAHLSDEFKVISIEPAQTVMVDLIKFYLNYINTVACTDIRADIPANFIEPIFFAITLEPDHKTLLRVLIRFLAAQIPSTNSAILNMLFKLYRIDTVKPVILEVLKELITESIDEVDIDGRNLRVAAAAIAILELNLVSEFSDLLYDKMHLLEVLDTPIFFSLRRKLNLIKIHSEDARAHGHESTYDPDEPYTSVSLSTLYAVENSISSMFDTPGRKHLNVGPASTGIQGAYSRFFKHILTGTCSSREATNPREILKKHGI